LKASRDAVRLSRTIAKLQVAHFSVGYAFNKRLSISTRMLSKGVQKALQTADCDVPYIFTGVRYDENQNPVQGTEIRNTEFLQGTIKHSMKESSIRSLQHFPAAISNEAV
jgi:hypothetical protein